MARQVFFDPFGKATEGYNLGMQQEQNLQSNMRQARQSDWDFNQMNPYRLAQAQRQNTLETSNLPWQMRLAPLAVEQGQTELATRQMPLAQDWFRLTGQSTPWQNINSHLFGMTPHYGPNGQTSFTGTDTAGNPVNMGGVDYGQVLARLGLPQEMAWDESRARQAMDYGYANYGRVGPGAYQLDVARANALINGPQAQNASPVDRFFHPQQPSAPQQPSMQPYNLPAPQMPMYPQQYPQPMPSYDSVTPQQIDAGY